MIDLFGLNRETQPEPEPKEPSAASARAPNVWIFLLFLDSLFIVVFGGALTAKLYRYRSSAVPSPAPTARRQTAAPAPKAPKPSPEAPKPAEPAAPAIAAAKPEPPKTKAPEMEKAAPRPPKPSLLVEPPKPRETPKPHELPKTAAGGPAKARPVEFRLHAPSARDVQLVGAFIVRGGRKEMVKRGDGSWTVTLYLNPGQYRYFFSVDRKKIPDPENPAADRGASLLTVP